jgi:hypothetical protein
MLALGAAYTLPGYAAWGLPVAALDHRSRVSRIVAATGVVLLMIYEILRHPFAGPAGTVLHGIATVGGPLVMVVLVIAMLRTRGAGGRPATVEEQSPSGELGNAGRTTEESIMDHAELEPARIS